MQLYNIKNNMQKKRYTKAKDMQNMKQCKKNTKNAENAK